MPYWQTFYHIVWATKNREALVTPDVEDLIYGFIRAKAVGLHAAVFALNGMPDHVHLVASVPPGISLAAFIGQVKGVTSTKFNKSLLRGAALFWQADYGVFTFDHKRLPNVVAYVKNQKAHHAQQNILPIFERVDADHDHVVRDADEPYVFNDANWWQDMLALDNDRDRGLF